MNDTNSNRPDRRERPEHPGHREPPRPEEPGRPEEDRPERPRTHGVFLARDRARYTPFIVLRYTHGDSGARPLAPGTVFWHSPDVWVTSSAGYNVPVAGEINRVFARVNNWGMQDAAGVLIRYWWANPSLAITEASAHLIGTAGAFVPSGYSVVVECPASWVPVIENQGHECVFAEAWIYYYDPIVAPLEPVNDRHVCQKNLHVLEVAPGQLFSLALEVANISPLAQQLVIQARALPFRQVHRALTSPELAYQERLVEPGTQVPIELDLAPTGAFLTTHTTTYARRLLAAAQLAAAGDGQQCQPVNAVARGAAFQPWETRTLTLRGQVPRDARAGQAFAFEVSQRMGPVVTGGYTLYLVVTRPVGARGASDG